MNLFGRMARWWRESGARHAAYMNQPHGRVHCNICYDVGFDYSGLRCKCVSGSESNG